MFYTSFLEMANREDELCRDIQLRMNVLAAADQVEKEGVDTAAHSELLRAAGRGMAADLRELHMIRAEMGGRLMMYEDMAAKVLRDKMNQPGGDGK